MGVLKNVRLIIALYFIGLLGIASGNVNPRIIELNNKFLDIKRDGYWLVMFYAPWCSYCKRLDPIWSHVQQTLHDTGIRVCRIDCVTYPSTCRHFDVNSYPTIMLIKGEESTYTFNGDRTRSEIVHFALRVASPPIKHLREDSDQKIKDDDLIFFVYVGDPSGNLWEAYEHVALKFQPYSYFFYAPPAIAQKYFKEITPSTIFVRKESQHYTFDENEWEGDLNTSLTQWVNAERFPTFVKVTRLNINIVMETNKYLVLVVVEENKAQEIPTHMLEFRNMVESVMKNYRDRFHKFFQFGWIGAPDLANSIAMKKVPVPFLLVLNSSTHHHHVPEDESHQLTPEAITIFLDSVQNQSAKAYGGNTFLLRLYRRYFEITTSLADMWRGNPVLTAVIFGLPFGFLSLIFYSICCADILDANDDDDDDCDEDAMHEKRE